MKRARHAFLRGFVASFLCVSALTWTSTAAAALVLKFGRVDMGAVSLESVEVRLPEQDSQPGSVSIQRLSVGGRYWRRLALHCGRMSLTNGIFQCRDGRLDGVPVLRGAPLFMTVDTRNQVVNGRVGLAGGYVDVRQDANQHLTLRIKGLSVATVAGLVGDVPAGLALDGQFSGTVVRQGRVWTARLDGSDLAFSDASGLHAAEGVAIRLAARAELVEPARIQWQADVSWLAGDVFWNPSLVTSGWQANAAGRFEGDQLRVDSATLSGPGLAKAVGDVTVRLKDRVVLDAGLSFEGADLAQLIPQFVLPVLVPDQIDRWRVAGAASGHVRWQGGALQSALLKLDDAGFSYLGKRFRVGPVNGELPWHRGQASQWALNVDGLSWARLSFAPFSLMATATENQILMMPARLPVLDGAIVIDALRFALQGSQWRGSGSLYSEPISLKALTEALALPSMNGTLSVAVPGIVVNPDRIGLDGTLVVSVFDGYLQATGLDITDPFGLLPRLSANVNAEHLDLAQLTQTFSFGSVSGFIDANVDGLVLAKWKPVRFDARIHSSAGDYERRISQRAVENITALGGEGAMAAVQRSVLRLFNDFGYREIGFSCQLRGNVCQMSGLDGPGADDAPFKLVAGGGIPALDVIGYNRRVDWAELIERLLRATSDGAEPIVK